MPPKIFKYSFFKSDSREWIQYDTEPFTDDFQVIDEGIVRPKEWEPPSLRYNKMRDEYVAISASRTNRPFLPPEKFCPLCPVDSFEKDANGNVIKTDTPITSKVFKWAAFENMFPSLSSHNHSGYAEVILYTPEHSKSLSDFTEDHIEGLIKVWQDRSLSISSKKNIKHVFIFENKGEQVGVTLHHPHGQIYAFDHLPPFIEREWQTAKKFHDQSGKCLVCDIAESEKRESLRVVFESDDVIAFVPEAARYPFEVHLTTKTHRPLISDLNDSEVAQVARALKHLVSRYNTLFGFELPYIMAHHQGPHAENSDHYHWHIEFYPPHRASNKIKYLAGVESGTGFFVNDTTPESTAQLLRQ